MSVFTSTILITGGTIGLGYWAAYESACKHPESKIVICSRTNKDNTAQSLQALVGKHRGSSTKPIVNQFEWMSLDLSSTTNVRNFVATYASKSFPPIASLVLNAGVQYHTGEDLRLSPDGVEMTFAINHLGHALLFFLLKPYLEPDARIAITASGVHDPAQKTAVPDAQYDTAELLAHPTDKDGYRVKMRGLQRYASSKLANVLFTYALERRLRQARESSNPKHNWTVAVMDPGLMPGTGLFRDGGPVLSWIFMHVAIHLVWLLRLVLRYQNVHLPQESGRNLASLADKKGNEGVPSSGKYFEGAKEIDSSVVSHDVDKQEDLWRWTVDFLGKDQEEKRAFENF